MMPLMLLTSSFSLATIVFANPAIAPPALACLWLRRYTKKPFAWVLRQLWGAVAQVRVLGWCCACAHQQYKRVLE